MTTKALPNIIVKYRDIPRLAADRKRCPRTHHAEACPIGQERELFVRNGYRAVVCTGEAHSNAHIDHCMRCVPLWGVMAVKVNP